LIPAGVADRNLINRDWDGLAIDIIKRFRSGFANRFKVQGVQQMRREFGPFFCVALGNDELKAEFLKEISVLNGNNWGEAKAKFKQNPFKSDPVLNWTERIHLAIPIRGGVVNMKVMDFGDDFKVIPFKPLEEVVVTIQNAPFDVSSKELYEALTQYGEIAEIIRGKYEEYPDLYNGIRYAFFNRISKPIPMEVKFGDLKFQCYYRGMKLETPKCFNCEQTGHMADRCKEVCGFCHQPGHIKKICAAKQLKGKLPPKPADFPPLSATIDAAIFKFGNNPGVIGSTEDKNRRKTSELSRAKRQNQNLSPESLRVEIEKGNLGINQTTMGENFGEIQGANGTQIGTVDGSARSKGTSDYRSLEEFNVDSAPLITTETDSGGTAESLQTPVSTKDSQKSKSKGNNTGSR
jgi:hypothetical protein